MAPILQKMKRGSEEENMEEKRLDPFAYGIASGVKHVYCAAGLLCDECQAAYNQRRGILEDVKRNENDPKKTDPYEKKPSKRWECPDVYNDLRLQGDYDFSDWFFSSRVNAFDRPEPTLPGKAMKTDQKRFEAIVKDVDQMIQDDTQTTWDAEDRACAITQRAREAGLQTMIELVAIVDPETGRTGATMNVTLMDRQRQRKVDDALARQDFVRAYKTVQEGKVDDMFLEYVEDRVLISKETPAYDLWTSNYPKEGEACERGIWVDYDDGESLRVILNGNRTTAIKRLIGPIPKGALEQFENKHELYTLRQQLRNTHGHLIGRWYDLLATMTEEEQQMAQAPKLKFGQRGQSKKE